MKPNFCKHLVALALAAGAAGCGSNEPVGGITNPNPGSVVDHDKGGTRSDLPVPNPADDTKKNAAADAASGPVGAASVKPSEDAAKGADTSPK